MSGTLALVLLIPLLGGIAAVGLLRANLLTRFRRPLPPPALPGPSIGETIVADLADPPPALPPPPSPRWPSMPNVGQIRLAAVAIAAAAIFFYVIGRVMAPPSIDDFVVLVAPFQESDGSITQTGQTAAERLSVLLDQASGGRVHTVRVSAPPADQAGAEALLVQHGGDVLVWGTIAAGGMLDGETLLPQIAYRPTGTYLPYAWNGYMGRFALPLVYPIATRPINGAVVLPALITAMADYGAGEPDAAMNALSKLSADYPALAPALPQMLIGNMLWAQGDLSGSADAYRRALVGADTNGKMPMAALLANNLGAVLQDAGDVRSREAFNQAIGLLNASQSDLGELRYNMALATQATGDQVAALAALEQADHLIPNTPPLQLDLGTSLRVNGHIRPADLADGQRSAQQVLGTIERQILREIDNVPTELRSLESNRLHARAAQEQGLVDLSILVDLRGPLLWGLEARTDLDQRALGTIRTNLDTAVRLSDERFRGWSARAATQDAAGHRVGGLIAMRQARQAELALREAQRWQAAVVLEVGESQNGRPPEGFFAIWAGLMRESSSLAEAKRAFEALAQSEPRDVELLILLGHDLLARGDVTQAVAQFNAADSLAPDRPEPPYGLALARLADQAIDEQQRYNDARVLLNKALERNAAFYPARMRLAEIAEMELAWTEAITQRRRLVQDQPSETTQLALGHTLRLSGPTGFAEAEALLLPIANNGSVPALVELSEIYRDYGNTKAQQDVLEHAQRLAPRNVKVAYDLGTLSRNNPDRSEAERQFRIALTADPRHVPSLLAMAELSSERPNVAADYYRRALDAGANDVRTLKVIGANMLTAGQNDLALMAFERASKNSPQDAEAQRGLARANYALNRLDVAQDAAQKALDLRSGNYAEAQIDLGDIALARNQLDAARDHYTAAIQLNPNLREAHIGLGRAIAAKGDWAVAVGHFRNAIAADPRVAESYLWLGEALIRSRDPSGALEQYKQALTFKPDYPEAFFGAAQAQMALGQSDAAEANLAAALKARPNYAEALLLQGKLFEQTNRERKALASYEAAISANSRLAEPHYRRALLLIQVNRLDEGRNELDLALQVQATFPEALYWRGRIDFAKLQYREALNRFVAAVDQAGGTYPEARLYQGLAEEQLGQRDDAIASFRAALTQGGTTPLAGEARAALARLGAQ